MSDDARRAELTRKLELLDKLSAADRAEQVDPPIDKSHAPLDMIAQKGLEALDYVPGLMRAVPASIAVGAKEGLPAAGQILKDAAIPFEGKPAISAGEALTRAGAPEMGEANLPLLGKVTGRGALGLGLDMALSPSVLKQGIQKFLGNNTMTARELGQRFAAQQAPGFLSQAAETMTDPAGFIPQKVGEKLYKSSFNAADEASRAAGQGAVSDVALKNNLVGTSRMLRDKLEQIASNNSDDVKGILARAVRTLPEDATVSADQLGARATHRLEEKATELGTDSEAKKVLSAIKERIDRIKAKSTLVRDGEGYLTTTDTPADPLNIGELNATKQNFQNLARKAGAYNNAPPNPNVRPNLAAKRGVEAELLGRGYADVAHAARRYTEDLADQASPGLGGDLYLKNRDTAAILSAEKPLDAAVKNSNPWIGPLVGGGTFGLMQMLQKNPALAAALGLSAGALGTDIGRTTLGLMGAKGGPAAGALLRSSLIENRNKSPWENRKDQNQ